MLPEINKILLATDLSEDAAVALRYAISLSEKYDAELILLHVLPEMRDQLYLSSGFDFAAIYDDKTLKVLLEAGAEKAKETVADMMRQQCEEIAEGSEKCAAITMNPIIATGNAVKKILEHAKECDLIVMGTKGHSKIGGILVGSVAQGVIAKSPTPVLIVRS
ncbi:universal stress protein [Halodesulfovibrio marinisediminis]|uniref:Nucleotide-binding universal stress protein, UspA family n=1 Tax=Halodesulfovibrio marinisediminis DSM 17456 TaxID=1121457 RepID=A0A1N6DD13_9BACT|nr:universal stress protein [Halodesulfovibrio marinisediminis]SIN68689.1 Nucleotide-binding universal stress protein, UspA family [Halodesulfovibrio marinisediminis DSM 17456]